MLLALAAVARAQGMADLIVHEGTLATNAREELKPIDVNSCTLQASDACIDKAGIRKVLRFSVLAVNRGTADLKLGSPVGDPRFVFSQCHNHYHFESFARYELRALGTSTVVKSGRKRSFCIEDLRTDPDNPTAGRSCTTTAECDGHGECANGTCQYNCNYQGIQPGRADIYESNLDCQWIDTTDVPPGDYDLWVLLNTEQLLPESDYTNDSGHVQVTVGPAPGTPVPTVQVRTKKKARVGKVLKIAWKPKLKGGTKNLDAFDVWLARDGVTFSELLVTNTSDRKLRWTVTGAPSDHAAIEVVAWTKAMAHGSGRSRPLRIVP